MSGSGAVAPGTGGEQDGARSATAAREISAAPAVLAVRRLRAGLAYGRRPPAPGRSGTA